MSFSLNKNKLRNYIKEYYEKNLLNSEFSYREFEDMIMIVFRDIKDSIESDKFREIYIKYLGTWRVHYMRSYSIAKTIVKGYKQGSMRSIKYFCEVMTPIMKIFVKYKNKFIELKKANFYNLIKDINKIKRERNGSNS